MSRTRRLPLWAVLGSAAIIFSACAGTSPSPSPSAAASSAAASVPAASAGGSQAAAGGAAYPDTAIDCKNRPTGYTGEFSDLANGQIVQAMVVRRKDAAPAPVMNPANPPKPEEKKEEKKPEKKELPLSAMVVVVQAAP